MDKDKPEEVENQSEEVENADEMAAEAEQIRADLEKTRSEAEEYLDSLQRLKAEFENFRKRTLREQSEFLKMASQGLISELLPVLDNFERALEHEVDSNQLDDYKKGLRLVYGQLLDVLAKEGLSTLEPVGQPFDPTQHEALMQEESDEHPEGTVVRVLEKGYVLKDRIIRPAKVIVAQ
jgi:molecular chaperone GrpE